MSSRILISALCLVLLLAGAAQAQDRANNMPTLTDMSELAQRLESEGDDNLSAPVRILLLTTLLGFIPALLLLTTSFTRVVIVLSFIKNALTTRNIPPSPVVIGLSLFLTLFIMAPTLAEINSRAVQPYMEDAIGIQEAAAEGLEPLRRFMFNQTSETDLGLFINISGMDAPETPEDLPTHVLIPAFVISELRTAFELGFVLFLPFLVIDLIVASVLLSMGMMMLPPVIVSAPLKILLFVLVDGWRLIAESLVMSFGGL